MSKNVALKDYVDSIKSDDINKIINSLKTIAPYNFEQGKIIKISGNIPLFKFDYDLNLIDDLKSIGVTDVFDATKADLSKMVNVEGVLIDKAVHKASIEFSTEEIKAAAGCHFDYKYSVLIEEIDLTFDNPYLFLIRNKDTGEVWFAVNVYNPIENS